MEYSGGIFFFHSSFIAQFIEDELSGKNTEAVKLFKYLIFLKTTSSSCELITTDLITCNKTIEEISKKYGVVIKNSGAYFDLIEEKSIKEDIADKDLYSIKVLNNNRISTVEAYFICSEENKEHISDIASSNGYTFKVLSPSDYEI